MPELYCPSCEFTFSLKRELVYTCSLCQGNLQVVYPYSEIAQKVDRDRLPPGGSLWRFLPLLPLQATPSTPPVGDTPLFESPRLKEELGIERLWIKNDALNPSSSLKDRASAVALAWAKENHYRTVCAASTGNAGAAAALWASIFDLEALIFVPRDAPQNKLAQLQIFGATVIAVNGSYDQAFDLSREASEKFGWFNRNTGLNPLTREGKKTVAFEIAQQLNWSVPDWIAVPVGDGNIISGLWKGFKELHQLGWIDSLPRLLAVQARGSSAVYQAWREGEGASIRPVEVKTIADSIAVSRPRDGEFALAAIRESDGLAVTVSDDMIADAMLSLSRKAGVFAEPAAAAALAGLREALATKQLPSDIRALLLITGHGLKDPEPALKFCPKISTVEPKLSEVEKLLTPPK